MSSKVITLMFHRVHDESIGFNASHFARYLTYLVNNFPIVTPSDPLPDKGVAVCLTFDDAYFDFYHYVFPLLKQHNIKAILAVSPGYILDSTSICLNERLSVPYPQGMNDDLHQTKAPFCTFTELREMVNTSHVIVASHGYYHANLCDKRANVELELEQSKALLETKLNTTVSYFIYPYGRMTRAIHNRVSKIYDYGFRIGSSLNHGWDQKRKIIYRVDADHLWIKSKPIDNPLIRKLSSKYWLNRLRWK